MLSWEKRRISAIKIRFIFLGPMVFTGGKEWEVVIPLPSYCKPIPKKPTLVSPYRELC
jgi:hypothetical protein